MKFELRLDAPIYLQMARILEDAIISGELKADEKLPSVRELARLSRTNPNTVQKALAILSDKGLIYTKRTAGKYVRAKEKQVDEMRQQKARAILKQAFSDLHALGCSDQEIQDLLTKENRDGTGSCQS
ncbi:GntR family transcriptional regulator [Erysipelotrichaceae bacterium RD49]|nr:GntR family transcriptional regulator [Erysipelotrichaceae bacterium RD49]